MDNKTLIKILDAAIEVLEIGYDSLDRTTIGGLCSSNENLGKREALTHIKSLLMGLEEPKDFIGGDYVMTIKEAINILYEEATNEERTHSLEEIDKARDHLLYWNDLLEKENR